MQGAVGRQKPEYRAEAQDVSDGNENYEPDNASYRAAASLIRRRGRFVGRAVCVHVRNLASQSGRAQTGIGPTQGTRWDRKRGFQNRKMKTLLENHADSTKAR